MVKATPRISQIKTTYLKRTSIRRGKTTISVSPSKSSTSSLFSPSFSSPLPPPSPEFLLKRAFSDTGEIFSAASKRVRKMMNEEITTPTKITISPSLSGYLAPPLPPPPSPEFLRRTRSSPAKLLSTCTSNNASTSKEIKEERKMSEEWIMVNGKCECGKDYRIVVNKVDNQCHKLV